ncbi:hypothetical protein [Opitutus sp. GAS368]|jgi:hypothetical protein|uniref:ParE family toxin-like protein n=1 Tax=Opitutus sp. GAS368 TaxID=1882749 RepID=UPI000879CEFE|nr:hypothetical protein [Opitutus sp. GAS368]SDR69941.1 hypothetical protein SAMN05444173_0479 [Opitutus sp. GAS368]
MKSHATGRFWSRYRALPPPVQAQALKQYRLWLRDPTHPSLHFKPVGCLWSVRVTRSVRALGVRDGETMVWFWIGSHDEYERIIKE